MKQLMAHAFNGLSKILLEFSASDFDSPLGALIDLTSITS
jgi:hypothetical protein